MDKVFHIIILSGLLSFMFHYVNRFDTPILALFLMLVALLLGFEFVMRLFHKQVIKPSLFTESIKHAALMTIVYFVLSEQLSKMTEMNNLTINVIIGGVLSLTYNYFL